MSARGCRSRPLGIQSVLRDALLPPNLSLAAVYVVEMTSVLKLRLPSIYGRGCKGVRCVRSGGGGRCDAGRLLVVS